MATNGLQRICQMLREASSSEAKIQALTSLRRSNYAMSNLEGQSFVKKMSDEEFCELCHSVINSSITDNEKQHIEACRTLDLILPETKDKSFDFFKSILQINRKKRLKILLSLSILKDETIAAVACKPSAIEFLFDCFQSIQTRTMPWLSPENSENAILLKNIENVSLNENDDFEAKVVDRSMQLLCRICNLSEVGLSIRPFDLLIMNKVILLANMGHYKQRNHALMVFQSATKNDLSLRIKSMHKDIWESYKSTLQSVYCKRMTILVNSGTMDWATLWETTINFIGTDLHRGSGLVNSLLKVEEHGFRSVDPNRRQAFLSWKVLIDNFALEQRELATNRRIKLLCTPLYAKNSKTELMVLTKLEVWWHLICKVYPSIAELMDPVLLPYLKICFGPFEDKPLFVQKSDPNASYGKKFFPTQIYAVETFLQLIVSNEDRDKLSLSNVEQLPGPVVNSVFDHMYKIIIHSFGEVIVILAQLPEKDFKNKMEVCKIMWESLIKRIEGYDKMKVSMFNEVSVVIVEILKHRFHKLKFVNDFFVHIISKDFDNFVSSMQLSEATLMDLVQLFIQTDDFSSYTPSHYQSLESLLWHIIKPKDSDVYYPRTLELMQSILTFINNNAKKDNPHIVAVCQVWRILAKIAKKYVEDSQNINEGTLIKHNFETIENIIAFPFSTTLLDDHYELKIMAEAWRELYSQFDYQAELVVSVKPNEILDKMSNMIVTSFKKNKKCCDFAALCVDGLLDSVNYDHFETGNKESPIENLIKELSYQIFRSKSFAVEKFFKSISSFLLRLFTHSIEKTAVCLKNLQPVVHNMLTNNDSELETEIVNTWTTIIGLFKKLQKYMNYEILNCYKSTLTLAIMHLNKEISSSAFSILDMKNNLDEKSKSVLEDILTELEKSSVKTNGDIIEIKMKSNKKKNTPIKPVGSFLNRKSLSPSVSSIQPNGKENIKKNVQFVEPDSQDFVVIQSDVKLDVTRLTEHQKEMLKKRRDDIPAMYNDLSVSNSQDTQEIQNWFDARTGKSPIKSNKESSNNNDKILKTTPTSSFRNVAKVLTNDQKNFEEISVISPTISSPKKSSTASVEKTAVTAARGPSTPPSAAVAAAKKSSPDSATVSEQQPLPIVPKKLDFDSPEEFPPGESVSSNNSKMRRKSASGEIHNADVQQPGSKQMRNTRRSLQVGGGGVILRKFNSTDQLNDRRGKKRRNSETNSEGVLDIEREKRPRRDIPESISEEEASVPVDANGKKISKRQLTEMSRLKIDMVFKPLPSRRSAGKTFETYNQNTGRKSISEKIQHVSNSDKKVSVTQSKVGHSTTEQKCESTNKKLSNKSEKSKDDKKLEKDEIESSQSQSLQSSRRKLSEINVAPTEEIIPEEKDNLKKVNYTKTLGKSTARKSLSNKEPMVSYKKKVETQEEIDIEDVSTPADSNEKSPPKTSPIRSPVKSSPSKSLSKSPPKTSPLVTDTTSDSEPKSSQESDVDIVESSQEPSFQSKMDKVDKCFIKIQQVDVGQAIKALEEKADKDKIIEATQSITDDSSLSIIPASVELDKSSAFQSESKKIENNATANATSSSNYSSSYSSSTSSSSSSSSINSSPKTSRPFKPRAFPVRNRAAQMLGLATQGSVSISKLSNSNNSSSEKTNVINLTDDISILPLTKKDKAEKDLLRISSPVGSSRQEKIFNNMNNVSLRTERGSSPSTPMFCNLKNDGEKVSPKMDKIEKELEAMETDLVEDSLSWKSVRKELPMLEWSNANPPSLSASPSASILKRMQEEAYPERTFDTPNRKKRVSFADPPVSREMGYEIMTENSSPPRLEKLPTSRSPTSRKDSRRQSKLRLIQIELEKLEKENDLGTNSSIEAKLTQSSSSISLSPKIKLSTVIDEIPVEETKLSDSKLEAPAQSGPETDMIVNSSVLSKDTEKDETDLNKMDSRIPSELEDTVDVANLTSQNSSLTNHKMIPVSQINNSEFSDTLPVTDSVFSNPLSQETQSKLKTPESPRVNNSEYSDTLPVTDSVFSNPLSQETQTNVAKLIEAEKLDSVLPVFPALISCSDNIEFVIPDLVDPLFTNNLSHHLDMKSIQTIGDLAKLTERDVNRLPIKAPKFECIIKALTRYEEKINAQTSKSSPNVSSSTPLRKRGDKSKTLDDTFSVDDLSFSTFETKKSLKRTSTDNDMQTSPVKKNKLEEKKACLDMMNECDDDFLFETFINRFGAEKILEGYKAKMKEKSQKELKKETLNMLGLSMEDDSEASLEASSKTAGLQKVLKQLPKIFESDQEFYETVLKTYKKKFNPSDVLRVLKSKEIDDAITEEFNVSKLLNIINKRIDVYEEEGIKMHDSEELQSLLSHVSPSSIMKQVKERDELKTKEMFNILTESFDVLELSDMCNEAIKSGILKKLSK